MWDFDSFDILVKLFLGATIFNFLFESIFLCLEQLTVRK